MKRISKKVRDEAALICACSASWRGEDREHWYVKIGEALGASVRATELAAEALIAAETLKLSRAEKVSRLWSREEDAEAEALIRCGWLP